MNRCVLFESTIKSKYKAMTTNEKKIADYMVSHPEAVLTATTQSIREAVGVSTATVVRFCRTCGYTGFVDLKNSLNREYYALNNMKVPENGKAPESFRLIQQKAIGYHTLVIARCLNQCRHEEFEKAVEAIVQAKHIILSGAGGGKGSTLCLYDLLSQMGFPCSVYFDSVFEISELGRMSPSDVLIVISYTGRLQNAIANAKVAREKGATVISLTSNMRNSLAEHSDILLSTDSLDQEHFDSSLSARMAELAVIGLLCTLLSKWSKHTVEGKGYRKSNDYIELLRVKEQN